MDRSSFARVLYVDAQEGGRNKSDRQLALDIRKQVGTDDKLFAEYWATRPSEYLWITHAVAFCGILEGGGPGAE